MTETQQVTLAGFILACIVEDEAEAVVYEVDNSAHVLATFAAHRAIVELHQPHDDPNGYYGGKGDWFCYVCDDDRDYNFISHPEGFCDTLRALAQSYADREGFREEWRA